MEEKKIEYKFVADEEDEPEEDSDDDGVYDLCAKMEELSIWLT